MEAAHNNGRLPKKLSRTFWSKAIEMGNQPSFDSYQGYLFAIAYRMLGSVMDTEDMVQEAYLRWQKTPPDRVTSSKSLQTIKFNRFMLLSIPTNWLIFPP